MGARMPGPVMGVRRKVINVAIALMQERREPVLSSEIVEKIKLQGIEISARKVGLILRGCRKFRHEGKVATTRPEARTNLWGLV